MMSSDVEKYGKFLNNLDVCESEIWDQLHCHEFGLLHTLKKSK